METPKSSSDRSGLIVYRSASGAPVVWAPPRSDTMVKVADGVPVIVDCPAHQAFKITAEDLDNAITAKTRWLLLNSPCNPTGAVYSAEELHALADVLRNHPQVAIMRYADSFSDDLMRRIDDYIAGADIPAPPPTDAELAGGPDRSDWSIDSDEALTFSKSGIRTVIWATGFTYDFSWIDYPVTDEMGYPVTQNGATSVDGLYFCGLNWMTRRKSGILYGVKEDAKTVAENVTRQLHENGAVMHRQVQSIRNQSENQLSSHQSPAAACAIDVIECVFRWAPTHTTVL